MKKILLITVICTMLVQTSCFKKTNEVKLIPVESNDLWGYVDKKGSYVINPQFESAYPFFDGLAKVVSDGKIGYISSKGKYVISPQYVEGTDFSDGLAFVVTDNSYPICIDKKGNVVFKLNKVNAVEAFNEGLARFYSSDEKYGYVNTKGDIVIRAQFEECGPFSEGLAWVKSNDKYGYIDTKGNIIINYQFVDAEDFHEGLAAVSNGKMWGFVNKKGEYVINPQFEGVSYFMNGLAGFSNGRLSGYIDKTGKYVINPQFEVVSSFSNGLAACKLGEMWGYVDKTGKLVINPQFDGATTFMGNVALVQSNEKIGCINKKGAFIINPQFDNVMLYSDATGSVTSTYYDGEWFVNAFMGSSTSLGTVILNSFKQGSNLKTVANNKYFNSAEIEDQTTLQYRDSKPWGLDDDVEFEYISFKFSSPVYETHYDYYYYESERTYQWSSQLFYVNCVMTLHGEAYGHGSALASALADHMKSKHNFGDLKRHNTAISGYSVKNMQGIIIVYDNSQLDVCILPISKEEFDKYVHLWCEDNKDEEDNDDEFLHAVDEYDY